MSDITNDFIYGVYLSQLCWLQLSRLRQHMSNNKEWIGTFTKVPLFGRAQRLSLLRWEIKPVVLGKRIELIRTDNPYADLKPGDSGTVVDVSELSYEDKPFKVWVLWDSGSRLTILEGHDDYRMVYDDDH